MEDDAHHGQDPISLAQRPGILIVGSPNVGKRTLLSRLIAVDFEDAPDLSPQVAAHGWTINTKYYTADVSVWTTHLQEGFFMETLPVFEHLVALVMVFDMNDLSSFVAVQNWVSRTDIGKFEILLCIGNKVDLIPGHSVHAEYRRHLMKKTNGDSSADFQTDPSEYGISEAEGSSLLGEEEPWQNTRMPWMDWCTELNIEFVEACASNADFDKCLSVNGDSQGVERIYGALSAHMWPGMVLKSGKKIAAPYLSKEDLSEEESEYEFEYEILSAEPSEEPNASNAGITETKSVATKNKEDGTQHEQEEVDNESEIVAASAGEPEQSSDPDEGTHLEFEDLEQLMSEIGNIRDNLRLMPDFQRRDMAANFALKMAAMFGDCSDNEAEN